jgi:electron transfer flavoprotein alpha subunit
MFTKAISRAVPLKRNFATLVLAEHYEGKLNANFGSLMTAASQLKDTHIDVLVHGADCQAQIDQINKYAGVRSILVAKDPSLQQSFGASVAKVV